MPEHSVTDGAQRMVTTPRPNGHVPALGFDEWVPPSRSASSYPRAATRCSPWFDLVIRFTSIVENGRLSSIEEMNDARVRRARLELYAASIFS